jgi:hypothetical protein
MLSDGLCTHLDEYLAGDLVGPPREDFERHLSGCPQCRDEAESFSRLAEVLEVADGQLVCCPARLPVRIRKRVSRRRLRWRIMAAAAVAVLLAIAGFAWRTTGRSGPQMPLAGHENVTAGSSQSRELHPALEPRRENPARPPRALPELADSSVGAVSIEFNDDVIGVPIETGDPSVTLLWVYPTLSPVAAGD